MNQTLILHEFDNRLTKGVARLLEQCTSLLGKIDDAAYTEGGRGSIGGHVRHCLDFVNCFLAGAQAGAIDYNLRRRDEKIQNSRAYAAVQIKKAIAQLQSLPVTAFEKAVSVRLEDQEIWCESSVLRELEYLQSHTTHHFALIGFKLEQKGFPLPEGFGVAPSTLKFWQTENKAA